MTVIVEVRPGNDGATQEELDFVGCAINRLLQTTQPYAQFQDVRFGVRGTGDEKALTEDGRYEDPQSLLDELINRHPQLLETPVVVAVRDIDSFDAAVFVRADSKHPNEDLYRSRNPRHMLAD